MAVRCGQEFSNPNRFTRSNSRSVKKMVLRRNKGWGSLVSAMQWSVLQFLLWAVATHGGETTSTPCGHTAPLENCRLLEKLSVYVCKEKENNQPCRISMRVNVSREYKVSLNINGGDHPPIAILQPFVQERLLELSFELIKHGSMEIQLISRGSSENDTVESIVDSMEPKVGYLLNPAHQVVLVEVSGRNRDVSFASPSKEEDKYCLLRCVSGQCPKKHLELKGWDIFQYRHADMENGSSTYVGRSNATSMELDEADWEVYRMVFINTCDGSFCSLCAGVNPAATSLMKDFGLLDRAVEDFNPCFLYPVLQSAKCDISNLPTGQCLQPSELNMSSLNIGVSLSSPLKPIQSLIKLSLSNCTLSGNLSVFNRFQKLTYLDLSGNSFKVMNFEGSMPNLTHLNLARNHLASITLDELTGLQELSLMNNDLSGNFSNIFQGRNLRKLDIRLNSFSGEVPEDMLDITWFQPGNCELQGVGGKEGRKAPAPFEEEVPKGYDPCRSGSGNAKMALIVAAGVIGALLLGCAAFAFVYFLVIKKRHGKDSSSLPRSNSSHEGTGFLRRQKLHDVGFPREFGIREIEAATETATTALLGKGAFGDVFEATLEGSRVVIKFRAKATTSLLQEFQRDVKKLGSYHHKNLVKVLGFCDDKEYQALVIEWMPNGSLEYHLYGSRIESALDWRARLQVLAGAASGIEFLHGGDYRQICYAGSPLIHCDIKSSNILLGDQFEAKVADFGYFKPKLFGDKFHSDLRYFEGYLDPEYLLNDQKSELDKKSDVFSFGVVILETVTGRPPIDTFGGQEPLTIAQWVRNRKNDGNLKDIVDPRLPEGSYLLDVVKNVVEVALECLNASSSARPTMKSVRRSMEEAYKTESRSVNSMSMELPSLETQPSGHLSR